LRCVFRLSQPLDALFRSLRRGFISRRCHPWDCIAFRGFPPAVAFAVFRRVLPSSLFLPTVPLPLCALSSPHVFCEQTTWTRSRANARSKTLSAWSLEGYPTRPSRRSRRGVLSAPLSCQTGALSSAKPILALSVRSLCRFCTRGIRRIRSAGLMLLSCRRSILS